MSAKQQILSRLPKGPGLALPDFGEFGIVYPNLVEQFKNMLQAAGGEFLELENRASCIAYLQEQVLEIDNFLSLIREIHSRRTYLEPHSLDGLQLTIVEAQLAVAENAAVWIPETKPIERTSLFIAEKLIVLLSKDRILNNLHQAYQEISFDKGFGVFISGPSKTADIEQALVVGAQATLQHTVLLYSSPMNFSG